MKKIGMVGGVGWLSTVDYYAGICRLAEQWHRDRNLVGLPSIPEMSIESLELNKAISCLGVDGDEDSWWRFDLYHRAALQRLAASGCDIALLASNSPHHRFASIVRGVRIPIINLFEVVAREAARIGAGEVLILGTRLIMNSTVFRDEFARHGICSTGPRDEVTGALTTELITELQLGQSDGAADRLGEIAKRSLRPEERKTPPLVCLACTELPLAFPDQKTLVSFEHDGIRYLNTAALHMKEAFELAVN